MLNLRFCQLKIDMSNEVEGTPSCDASNRSALCAVYGVPIVLMLTILQFSPNYQSTDGVRADPLGGDFLQEYVGGVALRELQHGDFYDLAAFRELQHDPATVGFQWDDAGYFPLVYPPFYYAAFVPMTKMPYETAVVVWVAFITGCFLAAVFLLHRFAPGSSRILTWAVPLCLLFTPLIESINGGQKGTLLLLLLTATWLMLKKDRPFAAGVTFGFIAFKPHLAILIGVVMLCKNQWAFVSGALATVGVLAGVSLMIGPDVCLQFIEVTLGMGDYVSTKGYDLTDAHSFWGASQLLLGNEMATTAKLVTVLATLGTLVVVAGAVRKPFAFREQNFDAQFAVLVIATMLTSPHLFKYDLTVLLLPMFLTLRIWRENRSSLPIPWAMIGLFFAVGISPDIAEISRVQPTVAFMLVWIWQLRMMTVQSTIKLSNDVSPISSRLANGSANAVPIVHPQ